MLSLLPSPYPKCEDTLLSWISSPFKFSPFRKSNQERDLPVLTSKIHHPMREQSPSPQACWDLPCKWP